MSLVLSYKVLFQLLPELVALPMLEYAIVLEPADDNAWADPERLREVVALVVTTQERGEGGRRDESVTRKAVRFLLVPRHFGIDHRVAHVVSRVINHERPPQTVQQDVGNLVEEGEPQLIGPLIPHGQPHH